MADDYYIDTNRVAPTSADASDWDNASDNPPDVFSTATSGDTVHVKAGRIKIDSGVNDWEIPAGVTVYGGYPNDPVTATDVTAPGIDGAAMVTRYLYGQRTVIDGDGAANCILSMGAGATLDGFEFVNGYSSSSGGAVALDTLSGVNFTNCAFRNCSSGSGSGGAIYATSVTNLILQYCEFGLCSAVHGGAVRGSASTLVVAKWCRFFGNTASGSGGAIYTTENLRVIRSLLTHNYAGSNGGAIYGDLNIWCEGSTVCDNEAAGSGGGIMADFEELYITNSIIRDNVAASNSQYYAGGSYSQTYSNVEGGTTGSGGNIDDDPDFRAHGQHPYEPESSTDNCDSADDGTTYFEDLDFRGRYDYDDPNTSNTGTGDPYDMGAYEYIGVVPPYLNYTRFIMDFDGMDNTFGNGSMYWYGLIELPKLPVQWADPGAGAYCKVDGAIEMRVFETDTELSDRLEVGGKQVFSRTEFSVSSGHTDPTWEEAVQDSESPYWIGHHIDYPNTLRCRKIDNDDPPRFAIVEYRFTVSKQTDTDNLMFFNIFICPKMDDADAKDDAVFRAALHGSPTTDRYGPDMPVSAYHMKDVVMRSMLAKVYESITPICIPLYGWYNYDSGMV